MDGAGPVLKKNVAWPSILGIAVLLASLTPRPGAAQTARGPGRAAAPAVEPTTGPPPSVPESTVSPAIGRFMKESGRDQLPLPTPPPANPPTIPPVRPSPPSPPDAQGTGRVSPGSNPLATGLALKPAPVEPTDLRFPINLATALRLSDARPLIVAAAQAGVWVAEADLTRAKVVWVPAFMLGADYLRHDGGGPDFNKGIMTAPSTNYFYAGPGLNVNINVTDAIFQPLAARQVLNARHHDVQSAKNDALLQTADAYFLVHQYRGTYAGALYAVERGRELVAKVDELSREFVPKDEVARARNVLADLEQRAVSARQEWRVRSANLTQVLRLDPRAVVEPMEHDHAQVTLIDPGRDLDELMPVALMNRPELASRRAIVEAAEVGIRQEKARPLLPVVMVNGFQSPGGMLIQGGVFGLGPNSSLNQFRGRDDVSLQLVWQLDALGVGNLARIKGQRGRQSQAIVDLRRAQDMVVADVTRSRARVQSAAVRVVQADRALRTGIITFNGHLEGLGQTRRFGDVLVLTFRPQEAVYSLQLLNTAFAEYFATVADYNRAQFELFHALGYPARELGQLRPPGEALPVDTSRPGYLPPVGNGPPPATR